MSKHRRARPLPGHSLLRSAFLLVGVVSLAAAFAADSATGLGGRYGRHMGDSKLVTTSGLDAAGLHSHSHGLVHPANDRRRATATPTHTQELTPAPRCSGPADTPDGADPWGGCWPGPDNTGVPLGTSLSVYHGSCELSADTIIDDKAVDCALNVNSGNLTIENSMVDGEVYNNGSGSVLIKNTTMNGGRAETETVLGSNVTILDSNLYGNQHEVYCSNNCIVKNSWLHSNHDFGSADHQNGFLSTGGSGYNLQHNSVYCVGGCTGDITFIPNKDVSDAVVNNNLFVATADAAYCLYPSSDFPAKPGIVEEMTITDNVFQRGPNGNCAHYGPVYGWVSPNNDPGTDGYHNVWSGNIWDDGKVLNP
jgi:hypothetical protein